MQVILIHLVLATRTACNNELSNLFTFFYAIFNRIPEMNASIQS